MIAPTGRQKWRREESDISRVLFPGSKLPGGGYLSGTPVTWRLKRFFARGCPRQLGTGKRPTLVPSTLHPTGVYRASTSRCCWCALTAPLHPYQSWDFRLGILDFGTQSKIQNPQSKIGSGGIFLWHSPHAHAHWALPSKSGLSGARTFLKGPALTGPPQLPR
jgi:hypothetical protein